MSDDEDLAARLEAVRRRRGYLLPHHGLLALDNPRLIDAYDALYTALALEQRVLDRHAHEFVWLSVLLATDEAIATHHVAKFQAAGGTREQVELAIALTGAVAAWPFYRFAARWWSPHVAGLDGQTAYLEGFRRVASGLPAGHAHLAAVAVHTCRQAWDGLAVQLRAAYADGVPEAHLAEALSLTMFSGSVPFFVEGARVWRELIAAGELDASPRFRAWAALAGQGGFDEAAGADQ